MEMKIKKVRDKAILPTRGSMYAAGYDLYAALDEPIGIPAYSTVKIPTGIATEIPSGYFGAIYARSGLATKYGIRPGTCVSIIDEDYRGEWFVPLYNDSDEDYIVSPGDRIAQVVFQPYLCVDFEEVDELDNTARGASGFGSTGKN